MPVPAVPEAEFVELWKTHKSATKVASVLGVSERSVHNRRRDIEARRNIRLEAEGAKAHHYKYLHPVEYAARKHASIENGHAIVWSDAHFWPGVRTTAFKAVLMFTRELRPKVVINNGDAFDGASISRHPRIGWEGRPTVSGELDACKERHAEIDEEAKDAKKFWNLGNHDARFSSRLAANAPEYEGVTGFDLKEHFPTWTPAWSTWLNDDVVTKHRFKNGIHATHLNTLHAGKTIITGHLHSLKVTPFDDYDGTRWGVDAGTLADPLGPQFSDYLEDNPTNWRQGFVVLTFHNGKLLTPEVCRVQEFGKVDFRGCVLDVSGE